MRTTGLIGVIDTSVAKLLLARSLNVMRPSAGVGSCSARVAPPVAWMIPPVTVALRSGNSALKAMSLTAISASAMSVFSSTKAACPAVPVSM